VKSEKFASVLIGIALLLSGCTADDFPASDGWDGDGGAPVGLPVLFTVGNVGESVTRATIPYMEQNGRFVCTMYYHTKSTDTDTSDFDIEDAEDGGTMTTTWLKVNNNVGNSVYWNKEYSEVEEEGLDDWGFDKNATCFYWQNRLKHAFLALADYNQLTTNDGATTEQGKLKMYPNWDMDLVTLPDNPTEEQQEAYNNKLANNRYANAYDLTRGDKTNISQQPDPIMALSIMKPAGATQEANRVRLYFRHQFSQIQVNVKGADDNSANISAGQIEGVQLLGVSTEGYVSCRLNADGTVGPAKGKDVRLDEFSDAVLDVNQWGTSFQMFDMAVGKDEDGVSGDDGYAIGFLKSFNAIAFGQLCAIRITWHEGTNEEPGIVHVSTFEVPRKKDGEDVELRNLQSGIKYIYDLELRRGTLAVIRTQVLDWMQKSDLVYGADGTITN